MKGKELLELSIEELHAKGEEARGELFNTHVKHTTGQLENTARIPQTKQDIARCKPSSKNG